jgi:excisionase family DNA binding protein
MKNAMNTTGEPELSQKISASKEVKLEAILTVPEVAQYLKMSKAKVYYLIQRKHIPHVRIGRNVRVRESDLVKWIGQQFVDMGDVWYTPNW